MAKKKKEPNPYIVMGVILSGFVIFLALLIAFTGNSLPVNKTTNKAKTGQEGISGESLGKYFNNLDSSSSSDYLKNDPFRGQCDSTNANPNTPAYTYGTVCFQ